MLVYGRSAEISFFDCSGRSRKCVSAIFFVTVVGGATGDVRGVFGGALGTSLPGGLGTSDPSMGIAGHKVT